MDSESFYTTPEEQIEKLKKQHLVIEDESYAKYALQQYGYSNLIKSYRDPYVYIENGKKLYRENISFNHLASLYEFDKTLRNAVMASMLDLEEHIKEAAADVIASSFGIDQNKYLDFKNYNDRRKSKKKPQFKLANILKTMRNKLSSGKDPIHHCMTKNGIVPPWILFKSVYLTTIVNFINCFKSAESKMIASRLYDMAELNIDIDSARKLMMDTLFLCVEYRNNAAHGSRIYNHTCSRQIRSNNLLTGIDPSHICFGDFVYMLSLFKYQAPYQRLSDALYQALNDHCLKHPEDITYLANILHLSIYQQAIVYVTDSSNKYHTSPFCSGIKNSRPIDLNDAEQSGYIPCKRCCIKK